MPTIFRIQDVNGRGPWKPGFSHRWVETRPDHDKLPPWFHEFGRVDKKVLSGMSMGSGCTSIEQLRRWFTPSEYATLKLYGYRAVMMESTNILAQSNIQCVFERIKPLHEDVVEFDLYPAE